MTIDSVKLAMAQRLGSAGLYDQAERIYAELGVPMSVGEIAGMVRAWRGLHQAVEPNWRTVLRSVGLGAVLTPDLYHEISLMFYEGADTYSASNMTTAAECWRLSGRPEAERRELLRAMARDRLIRGHSFSSGLRLLQEAGERQLPLSALKRMFNERFSICGCYTGYAELVLAASQGFTFPRGCWRHVAVRMLRKGDFEVREFLDAFARSGSDPTDMTKLLDGWVDVLAESPGYWTKFKSISGMFAELKRAGHSPSEPALAKLVWASLKETGHARWLPSNLAPFPRDQYLVHVRALMSDPQTAKSAFDRGYCYVAGVDLHFEGFTVAVQNGWTDLAAKYFGQLYGSAGDKRILDAVPRPALVAIGDCWATRYRSLVRERGEGTHNDEETALSCLLAAYRLARAFDEVNKLFLEIAATGRAPNRLLELVVALEPSPPAASVA